MRNVASDLVTHLDGDRPRWRLLGPDCGGSEQRDSQQADSEDFRVHLVKDNAEVACFQHSSHVHAITFQEARVIVLHDAADTLRLVP